MNKALTVGLPRLHKEKNEQRDFLPTLVEFLAGLEVPDIVIEPGYGSGLGLSMDQYLSKSARARVADREECMSQDVVLSLRCPDDGALRRARPGAVIVSMLHLDTRPNRAFLLRQLELQAVSLDLVRDDLGHRLVENLEAVALNGVRAAFRELQRGMAGFADTGRGPMQVTVLGAGAVGAHAVRVAVRYGDDALRKELGRRRVAGVEVTVLDYELAGDEAYLRPRLRNTDLLIDATRRSDRTQIIVPNAWLIDLPVQAVVLDLAVDPYDFGYSPPHVKAIEGLPNGDLDQFVFLPKDPAFDTLDARIEHAIRRTTLSCNSWPGVDPRPCMEVYSKQVEPVMRAVLQTQVRNLDATAGAWYDRATARALLSRHVEA